MLGIFTKTPHHFAVILVVFFCMGATAQEGAVTVSRNLAELTDQASTIIVGRVVSAKVEPDPRLTNLKTVVVTLKVSETLKGKSDATFTFRQFIWDYRDIVNANGYRKGHQYLLLMNPPTPYGLSSPAGLGQGRFRILRDANGEQQAINDRNNDGLFRDLLPQLKTRGIEVSAQLGVASPAKAGPVRLNDVRTIIRKVVQVQPQ